MPSQYYHLIPEYANIGISLFSISKIIQKEDKKGYGMPKLFVIINLFVSVSISITKSIFQI